MNELEFLRSQLQLEQKHLDSSRDLLSRAMRLSAGDAQTDAARHAALAHLLFALRRATERGRIHVRQASARIAASGLSAAEHRPALDAIAALQTALAPAETTLAALAQSTASGPAASGGDELHAAGAAAQQFADRLGKATATLEPWFARLYDLSDWRRAAQIDAEAVFEDRRLHEAALDAARAARLLE